MDVKHGNESKQHKSDTHTPAKIMPGKSADTTKVIIFENTISLDNNVNMAALGLTFWLKKTCSVQTIENILLKCFLFLMLNLS